jgi:hypothetical protein
MSQELLTDDAYMVDTQRLAIQDAAFAEWRHNGSEYLYWSQRLSSLPPRPLTPSPFRPYILRLITNGMSAHNFGHCNHDVLWPFIISANSPHELFSARPLAPIYVLDIGIFLLKFLRLAFPQRTFVGFRSMEEIYPHTATGEAAEEVIISGLGAPKSNERNTIRPEEMAEVRRHMTRICSQNSTTTSWAAELSDTIHCADDTSRTCTDGSRGGGDVLRILFIERKLTPEFKIENDLRYASDATEDHPALRHYYDSGYWSHTVLTSKRVLGSQRRHIQNFDDLVREFESVFIDLYHNTTTTRSKRSLLGRREVEVIRFNPEHHSFCDQILTVAQANVRPPPPFLLLSPRHL